MIEILTKVAGTTPGLIVIVGLVVAVVVVSMIEVLEWRKRRSGASING